MTELQVYTLKKKKQSPRRTKYEVWAELLESCKRKERTQYWLLHKLGLTTNTTKEALKFLMAAQLIEQLNEPKNRVVKYKTTAKGLEALNIYQLLTTEYFST